MRCSTVHAALREIAAALRCVSDAPWLEAERLVGAVLGHDEASWLYAHGDETLSLRDRHRAEGLVKRRLRGYPLAYLLGEGEFFGRPFYVNESVLIPRPSTEDLAQEALCAIGWLHARHRRPLTVADIGTGSGCLAVTLALETQPSVVGAIIATDVSAAALDVARRNIHRHTVRHRVTLRRGDLLQAIAGQPVDLIVSNPPYVPTAECARPRTDQATHSCAFEPRLARDGGPDGQRFTRALLKSGLPAVVETTGGLIVSALVP